MPRTATTPRTPAKTDRAKRKRKRSNASRLPLPLPLGRIRETDVRETDVNTFFYNYCLDPPSSSSTSHANAPCNPALDDDSDDGVTQSGPVAIQSGLHAALLAIADEEPTLADFEDLPGDLFPDLGECGPNTAHNFDQVKASQAAAEHAAVPTDDAMTTTAAIGAPATDDAAPARALEARFKALEARCKALEERGPATQAVATDDATTTMTTTTTTTTTGAPAQTDAADQAENAATTEAIPAAITDFMLQHKQMPFNAGTDVVKASVATGIEKLQQEVVRMCTDLKKDNKANTILDDESFRHMIALFHPVRQYQQIGFRSMRALCKATAHDNSLVGMIRLVNEDQKKKKKKYDKAKYMMSYLISYWCFTRTHDEKATAVAAVL